MIQLNGGLVRGRSFKHRCVAASSSEVEYVSLVECMQKIRYHHHILRDFGGLHELKLIYEENHQPCILRATEH